MAQPPERPGPPPGGRPLEITLDVLRRALRAGEVRAGFKVARNAAGARAHLSLDALGIGFLTEGRLLRSGALVPVTPASDLRVELEIAVRLGRAVAPSADPAQARAAIAAAAPALEILDFGSRPLGEEALARTNFSHVAAVLGPPGSLPRALDPASLEVELLGSDGERRPADPSLWPGDLGALLVEVARRLDAAGEGLRAGDRVLCGSLVQPLRIHPGGAVRGRIAPLGEVCFEVPGAGREAA